MKNRDKNALLLEAADLLGKGDKLNVAAIEVLNWQLGIFKETNLPNFELFLGPSLGKLYKAAKVLNPNWAESVRKELL